MSSKKLPKKIETCKIHGETDFIYITTSTSGSYTCRLCKNEYIRRKIADNKLKAIGLLGGVCCVCGVSFDGRPEVFDFHHTDPTKKEITPARVFNRSWENIMKEISKCVLICANCHRTLHVIERAEARV